VWGGLPAAKSAEDEGGPAAALNAYCCRACTRAGVSPDRFTTVTAPSPAEAEAEAAGRPEVARNMGLLMGRKRKAWCSLVLPKK